MPTWVEQRRDVWCRWTQAVYGPYALQHAVRRRIGGIALVQTRVAIFCFSQGFTGECDGAIGLQQCSPESSLRSINWMTGGFVLS